MPKKDNSMNICLHKSLVVSTFDCDWLYDMAEKDDAEALALTDVETIYASTIEVIKKLFDVTLVQTNFLLLSAHGDYYDYVGAEKVVCTFINSH